MNFLASELPDVLILQPRVFEDERGFFLESYQKERFAAAGIPFAFVQDNHSFSRKGVLRGLHYQIRQAQGKLVRVISGEVFDVAVDIRRSSPTFGQWMGIHISAENKTMLWIPPGFAHGVYILSEQAEVLYKTTDYYAPQWERTILWNDPALGIRWPAGPTPIVSLKDATGLPLSQAELFD